MRILLIAIGVAYLMFGCGPSQQNCLVVEKFPQVFDLEGEELVFERGPYDRIDIVDTFLLAFNCNTHYAFLDVFDPRTLALHGQLGLKGRAADEFLFLTYNPDDYIIDSSGLKLWTFDQLQNAYRLINVTSSLRNKKTVIDNTYQFDKAVINVNYINDSLVLTCSRSNEQKGLDYDLYDLVSRENTPVDMYGEKFKRKNSQAYRRAIAFLPEDKTKYVINFDFLNKFKVRSIYKTESDVVFSVFSKPLSIRDLNLDDIHSNKVFYNDITVRGGKIYGIYMDQSSNDIFEVPKSVQIHVFDIDGNPLQCYNIPQHIRFISVDERNKKIYGSTPEGQFFRYSIHD